MSKLCITCKKRSQKRAGCFLCERCFHDLIEGLQSKYGRLSEKGKKTSDTERTLTKDEMDYWVGVAESNGISEGRFRRRIGKLMDPEKAATLKVQRRAGNYKRVNQYTLDKVLIDTFDSVSEAGDYNDLDPTAISAVCNGRRNMTGGYIWEFADKED